MRENIEDLNLIQNILKGDSYSEKKLYEKYKKIVKDFLLYKYSNNTNLDDDVSEILIKIFTSISKYDSKKSKFKSWVFTIAKNYMIDKLRQCDILSDTITLDNYTNTVSSNIFFYNGSLTVNSSISSYTIDDQNIFNHTSSNITNFENVDTLNYISNNLTSCDFTFLNMKYSEGYNYDEIGMEFNLTSNTVSNRVNYIKSKIKKSIV